jgi:hypothetical protein
MSLPVQGQFRVRIYTEKIANTDTLKSAGVYAASDGSYIDIERCLAYPITYEEQASLLNTLTFTVDKFADILLYYFHIGQTIHFYGGRYSKDDRGVRHVFTGTVTRIRTSFSEQGRVTFAVECMSYGYTKMGKTPYNYVYPDESSDRLWAKKPSLSIADIVRGIAGENKFTIGRLELSPDASAIRFNKKKIRRQKDMSDWEFLQHLADDHGCRCWMAAEEGVDKLNFCSDSRAAAHSSDIAFVYPLKSSKMDNSFHEDEIQKFGEAQYDRPRILRSVQVDEDVSQAYAVTRATTFYNKETGEYIENVVSITVDKDGKTMQEFYQLDEARVAWIYENEPAIAKKIRDGNPASLPWGDPNNPDPNTASYYYKRIVKYDKNVEVFDKAFYGITVKAKTILDLDIKSQMSYKIRGILSYHSQDLSTSFFLRGLKHIWDKDGCWTELDFIR